MLGLISSGEFVKVGKFGPSSLGLRGINWDKWKDGIFLERVTAMGHSFGGVTTVQTCRGDSLSWIGQGVLRDAWGQATPNGDDTPGNKVIKPIFAICSEALVLWRDKFDRIMDNYREARESGPLCWMLTIARSRHLSMSNFAMLYLRIQIRY